MTVTYHGKLTRDAALGRTGYALVSPWSEDRTATVRRVYAQAAGNNARTRDTGRVADLPRRRVAG